MACREQGPHPEVKHLDTIPMKSVLKGAFRSHRSVILDPNTQVEHMGMYPQFRTPQPVDRVLSYVFAPPHDEVELMSTDRDDYVTHRLVRTRADGSKVDVVVSQNGLVRLIPDTSVETALDSDKLWAQIESDAAAREIGMDLLGEGEVSDLLYSVVEEPGLYSLLLNNVEFRFLDPDSKSELQPTTRELLKKVIEQLAQTDSEYRSTLRLGEDTVHITTRIPFGTEPMDDSEIPDSVANSSSVSVEVISPTPEDDRYETKKSWFYYVGKSRYTSQTQLSARYVWGPVFGGEILDDQEREERAEVTRRESDKRRDVLDAVKEHGLPSMAAHEWQEGMNILSKFNDGSFLEGLEETLEREEQEALDDLPEEKRTWLDIKDSVEPMNDEERELQDLIDRSSLGTPGARAIMDQADPEAVAEILRRARERQGAENPNTSNRSKDSLATQDEYLKQVELFKKLTKSGPNTAYLSDGRVVTVGHETGFQLTNFSEQWTLAVFPAGYLFNDDGDVVEFDLTYWPNTKEWMGRRIVDPEGDEIEGTDDASPEGEIDKIKVMDTLFVALISPGDEARMKLGEISDLQELLQIALETQQDATQEDYVSLNSGLEQLVAGGIPFFPLSDEFQVSTVKIEDSNSDEQKKWQLELQDLTGELGGEAYELVLKNGIWQGRVPGESDELSNLSKSQINQIQNWISQIR